METIDDHFKDDDAPKAMPNQIDVHVGCCVWQSRTLLGLSQEKLGAALGPIFQQLPNYERGVSRLFDIARELDAPILYFFADLADADTAQSANASGLLANQKPL